LVARRFRSKRKPKKRVKAKKKEKVQPKKKRRYRRKPKPVKKRGRTAYKDASKLFFKAGLSTQLQKERNDMRGIECMKQLRYGFQLIHREGAADCKRYKIGKPNSFDPLNAHGGVCWAWPKECKLTNLQARTLFYNIYKKGTLTWHQLVVVRKHFAYAFELSGGTPGQNFKGIKEVWKIVKKVKCADQILTVKPTRIPTPDQLRKAFTKEWTPNSPNSLVVHCGKVVAAYDWGCGGMRSTEDMGRSSLRLGSRVASN